jgi:hypothetical protein
VTKRRRAVADVLPRLRRTLGSAWEATFALHASGYSPSGTRLILDDAWEFADRCARAESAAEVREAGLDDLMDLRLKYRRTAPGVIERRRSPLVGFFRHGGRRLVVRLPGAVDRVLVFP